MQCDCLQNGAEFDSKAADAAANETDLEVEWPSQASGNLSIKSAGFTPFAFPSQLDLYYFKIGKHFLTINHNYIINNQPNEIWFSLLYKTILQMLLC